eukprot:1389585-Amorphochlora_amoeboformis.AAC.1
MFTRWGWEEEVRIHQALRKYRPWTTVGEIPRTRIRMRPVGMDGTLTKPSETGRYHRYQY